MWLEYMCGQQTELEGLRQSTCSVDCAVTQCVQNQDRLIAVFSEFAPVHSTVAIDDNLIQNITDTSTLINVKTLSIH